MHRSSNKKFDQQIKGQNNRPKIKATDQMFDQQIKHLISRSQLRSTDQILDQRLKSQTNRSTLISTDKITLISGLFLAYQILNLLVEFIDPLISQHNSNLDRLIQRFTHLAWPASATLILAQFTPPCCFNLFDVLTKIVSKIV